MRRYLTSRDYHSLEFCCYGAVSQTGWSLFNRAEAILVANCASPDGSEQSWLPSLAFKTSRDDHNPNPTSARSLIQRMFPDDSCQEVVHAHQEGLAFCSRWREDKPVPFAAALPGSTVRYGPKFTAPTATATLRSSFFQLQLPRPSQLCASTQLPPSRPKRIDHRQAPFIPREGYATWFNDFDRVGHALKGQASASAILGGPLEW